MPKGPRVWPDLVPHLIDPESLPEALRILLQRLRYGGVARIPKRGQVPQDVLRARVRDAVLLRVEQGSSLRSARLECSRAFGVHLRTVEKWCHGAKYQRTPPVE